MLPATLLCVVPCSLLLGSAKHFTVVAHQAAGCIERCAAAVNDKREAHTGGSSHQQPSRAPEPTPHQGSSSPPPQHQDSGSNPPFRESPPPCQPTNTTATVELDVKLRSLVLNLSTDSVCVGIRMMERFQQYQQHAHLWQGRPQVQSLLCSTNITAIIHFHTTVVVKHSRFMLWNEFW